ncbi:hypothetical protein DF186_19745, partial [Enterococcus hirae]
MDNSEFKSKYQTLKNIIEAIDPDSFGETNEYDDVLFQIIRENKDLTDQEKFAQNTTRIISETFDLEKENLLEACL